MKKIVIVILIIILIFGLLLVKLQGNGKKILTINNHHYSIEIADNNDKREQGLSNRPSLSKNSGMLFLFPTTGIHSFWMKDMKFPLDFVWIKNNDIVDITADVPPPKEGTDMANLTIYQPKEPVDKVLEINAGETQEYSIKIGDKISIK